METKPDNRTLAALRGARLMLYAWRGVRRQDKLPEHRELDETIRELETEIERLDRRD